MINGLNILKKELIEKEFVETKFMSKKNKIFEEKFSTKIDMITQFD